MTRWAISGGNGFLGSHVARRALAAGHAVRSLDPVSPDPHLLREVEWIDGDVRAAADAARLCAGADVVVHAAAALPIRGSASAIRSVGVDGTATLLAAAREAGVRRFVFISSAVVYGAAARGPATETTPLAPFEPYGYAKRAAEELCVAFSRRGLETVSLRPTAFVGPERLGVFGILFEWVRQGRRIPLLGDGTNRYQLLAVDDLVDAVVLAAERLRVGDAYVLGAHETRTVREELERLIAHARSGSRLRPIAAGPARAALAALDCLGLSPLGQWHYKTADRDVLVDPARARRELGWEPRSTSGEALLASYDWYAASHGSLAVSGRTHRTPWDERALALLRRAS